MRINDRYAKVLERALPQLAKPADKAKDTGKPGAAVAVKVSDRAQELSTRSDRVEELKCAIANGTYKVDARAIASRLLDGES